MYTHERAALLIRRLADALASSIHVHHAKEERPEQHVRAQAAEEAVGEQILSIDKVLGPIGAGLEEQQQPQAEHGDHVEQEAEQTGQAHDACVVCVVRAIK